MGSIRVVTNSAGNSVGDGDGRPLRPAHGVAAKLIPLGFAGEYTDIGAAYRGPGPTAQGGGGDAHGGPRS